MMPCLNKLLRTPSSLPFSFDDEMHIIPFVCQDGLVDIELFLDERGKEEVNSLIHLKSRGCTMSSIITPLFRIYELD